jgi:hypothetical protein
MAVYLSCLSIKSDQKTPKSVHNQLNLGNVDTIPPIVRIVYHECMNVERDIICTSWKVEDKVKQEVVSIQALFFIVTNREENDKTYRLT